MGLMVLEITPPKCEKKTANILPILQCGKEQEEAMAN